ncbi:uncharacterized protein LOC144507548 isoform X2 [Mustelus asterias]
MALKTDDLVFFDQASFRIFKKPRKHVPDIGSFELSSPAKSLSKVSHRRPGSTMLVSPPSPFVTKQRRSLASDISERPSSSAVGINVFTSAYADESEHMNYFEKLKSNASSLLTEIHGMILHCKIAGILFPRGLENILNYHWSDFIKEVAYNRKRWPTAACKYICDTRGPSQKLVRSPSLSPGNAAELTKSRVKSIVFPDELKDKMIMKFEQEPISLVSTNLAKKTKSPERAAASKVQRTGFTINFAVSSKACMDKGWIIKSYDETIAKLDWKEICTMVLERIQAENERINLEKAAMIKHGLDKPVILLHYEEARSESTSKFRKSIPVPEVSLLRDGKPHIPILKVENPALNKMYYSLNDGSSFIYYPSGNIAVCRSHSGLSCQGAFYTNIFSDSTLQPVLLASFTPFGHGSIFLSGENAMVLQFHEEGGVMIYLKDTIMKNWQWPRRGKLAEPIWVKFSKKRSSVKSSSFSVVPSRIFKEVTVQYLRQVHKRIKQITNKWMDYYRSETGLNKYSLVKTFDSDRLLQPKTEEVEIRAINLATSDQADYIRFLSAQEKTKCLPQSCTFTRDLASSIGREGNLSFLMASKRGSFAYPDIKQGLRFPKVQKDEKPWLRLPVPCPVALRNAMLGDEVKTCRCSTTKVPNITDLEYDTFIQKSSTESQQIIIVCVVTSQQENLPPYEIMVQELYEQNSRNRHQPCLECQRDAFRIIKYDISTANEYTAPSPVLLVARHNATPGMFLMYIGGKLLFADHIFNGYSNSIKDLKKQITKTYDDYLMGRHLLYDFRFSSIESELPRTAQGERSWKRQPHWRPKSEASIKPGTCIIKSSNGVPTIQEFIAFSLTQRDICCDQDMYQTESTSLGTLVKGCALKAD